MKEDHWSVPDELRAVWDALDDAAPEALPEEAARRIGKTVEATAAALRVPGSKRVATARGLAASIALALGVGVAGGLGIAAAGLGEDADPAASGGREYLLLVRETPGTERSVRERGLDAVVEEYARWAQGLAAEGRLVAAEKLSDQVGWVGGSGAQAPSSISGFFLIRAEDEEDALRIARGSPHAALGGTIEVRGIDPDRPEP